jgi:hypothetical protein
MLKSNGGETGVSVKSRIAELKAKLNNAGEPPAALKSQTGVRKLPLGNASAASKNDDNNESNKSIGKQIDNDINNKDELVKVERSMSVKERLAALRQSVKESDRNLGESKSNKIIGVKLPIAMPSPKQTTAGIPKRADAGHSSDDDSSKGSSDKGKKEGVGASIQERIMMMHRKAKSESMVDKPST